MQRDVVIRFESAAVDPAKVDVRSVVGREQISQLFEFTVHLVCDDPAGVRADDLLLHPCALVFELVEGASRRELRRIHAMVRSARDRLNSESRQTEYVVELAPRAWQASLTRKSDIFQDLSIPDIIKKKLEDGAGLAAADMEFRLAANYPPREFVVQYEESDLAFMQRWAEHLGIFYFFDHASGHDKIVWTDENAQLLALDPVHFMVRGETEGVFELESKREMVTRAFRSRDYNYRNPLMDVQGEAQIGAIGAGTHDEYGGHIRTPDEATHLARVRAEEANARHHVFSGKSYLPTFTAGAKVKVDGHPTAGDLELVLVSVEHSFVEATHGSGGAVKEYSNEFTAIFARRPYRPPLSTPKPRVPGVVSGLVQSASATEFGAIDDEGRYRVAFMYDSVARDEGKASRAIRMAQPSAGADRGFHIPLKAGTEVVVYCINGDPDRPIIAGAVPNPQTGSPVTAANAEKTILNTNRNSLAIDDAQPRAKLSVAGSDHIFQVGAPNEPEQGFATTTINNVTTIADEGHSTISAAHSNFTDMMDAFSSQDITAVAGLPISRLKKADAILKYAATLPDTVKSLSKTAGGFVQFGIDSAKAAESEAKDERKKAQDELFAKKATDFDGGLGPVFKPKPDNPYRHPQEPPRMVTPDDGDGTQRPETEDEFRSRVSQEIMAEQGFEAETLQALADKEHDATKARADAEKSWEESVLNAEAGPGKDYISNIEKVLKTASTLFSTLVKILSKAARIANFEATKAMQVTANVTRSRSSERKGGSVGKFGEHYNIQGATDSVGLMGMQNTFVFGTRNATMYGKVAAVVADDTVHVKSVDRVEVSSKSVQLSAKRIVDVYSGAKMRLVARPDAKGPNAPGDNSIFMLAEKGIHCASETKSIDIKAKEHVNVTAETKDLLLDATTQNLGAHGKARAYLGAGPGDGWGLVATGSKLQVGKLSSADKLTGAAVKLSNGFEIRDDFFDLKIKESRTMITPTSVTLSSGGAKLTINKDGDIVGKTGKNVTFKGSKVLLN